MTIENGIHSLTSEVTTDACTGVMAENRSRILSDFESIFMDLRAEGDDCIDTGFPSPFSAGMLERWRFPTLLDDEYTTMSDDELQKEMTVVQDEQVELDSEGGFNVKDELADYELEPYSESFNSGSGSYEEMLRSARQRIERACDELAISFDATEWTVEQVHTWCTWVCRLFNIQPNSSRLEQLRMNGHMLCSLSKVDFEARLPQIGEYLYTELELWKNVFCLISPALTLDMSSLMTTYSSSAESKIHTDNYTDLNTTICSPSFSSSSQTILSNASRSVNSLTPRPSPLLLPQCVLDASNNSPAFNYLSGCDNPILSEIAMNRLADFSQDSDAVEVLTKFMDNSNSWSCTSSLYNSTSWSSSSESASEDFKDQRYTSSSTTNSGRQSNHLWQFLKELLSQECLYQNCIRWLDRSKGIFKIEDSSRVAKLWGQRKNRPAMNYDKLSRSIRQYYKKGIIKKTSQSKRLVYQFCPSYA